MKFISNLDEFMHLEHESDDQTIKDMAKLKRLGIKVSDCFIVRPNAYIYFLQSTSLFPKIAGLISTIHYDRADSLMQVSNHIKKLITTARIPREITAQIESEFKKRISFFKKPKMLIEDKYDADNPDDILQFVKKIWAEQFEPSFLLRKKDSNLSWITRTHPLLIQKKMNRRKSIELQTGQFNDQAFQGLNQKEKASLKKIANKINRHFFLPHKASFVLDKNNIYVVSLKPMTNVHKSYLVLIRHGRSEYNEKGLWAGWDDPPLTENGIKDSKIAAQTLKDVHLDIAYTSPLVRHKNTLEVIKNTLDRNDLPVIVDDAILERNYGVLTKKNKWEIQKQYGDKQFMKWRRGWDEAIENGESLKDVYDRIVPYYRTVIFPRLKSGKNILMVSSGNCLRAMIKYLENISDNDIPKFEVATGEVYIYQFDEDGKVVGKEIRNQHENKV